MKSSLGISNFLEEISSLSHSVVFLYIFALSAEEGFLISVCYSLELREMPIKTTMRYHFMPVKMLLQNLPIDGVTKAKALGAMIFHAGTKILNGELVTSGGRVLGVTTTAPTLREAVDKVYRCVEVIHFDEMHYRKDIAARGLSTFHCSPKEK